MTITQNVLPLAERVTIVLAALGLTDVTHVRAATEADADLLTVGFSTFHLATELQRKLKDSALEFVTATMYTLTIRVPATWLDAQPGEALPPSSPVDDIGTTPAPVLSELPTPLPVNGEGPGVGSPSSALLDDLRAELSALQARLAVAEFERDAFKSMVDAPRPATSKEVRTLIQQGLKRPEDRAKFDAELADHLNQGWSILDLRAFALDGDVYDFYSRVITLVRDVPAALPQPEARAAAEVPAPEPPAPVPASAEELAEPPRIILDAQPVGVLNAADFPIFSQLKQRGLDAVRDEMNAAMFNAGRAAYERASVPLPARPLALPDGN